MRKKAPNTSPSIKQGNTPTKAGLHVVLPTDLLESIRALAFFDRTTVTRILSDLIRSHLKDRKADLKRALTLYREQNK